jgi:hypothetical protein
LRDRHALAPERFTEPLRLLATGGAQVALGLAVLEPEARRVADARLGFRVPDEDHQTAGTERRPDGFVRTACRARGREHQKQHAPQERRGARAESSHVPRWTYFSRRTGPPSG